MKKFILFLFLSVFIFLLRKYSAHEKQLENDGSVSTRHKNIKALAIKVLKNIIGLSLHVWEKGLVLIVICATWMTLKVIPNIFLQLRFLSQKREHFARKEKSFLFPSQKSLFQYLNFRVLVS